MILYLHFLSIVSKFYIFLYVPYLLTYNIYAIDICLHCVHKIILYCTVCDKIIIIKIGQNFNSLVRLIFHL